MLELVELMGFSFWACGVAWCGVAVRLGTGVPLLTAWTTID
jgi:hypothetical protein